MNQATIFQPVITLIALTFAVALWMLYLRFKAVGDKQLSPGYFRIYRGGREPEHLTQVTHHFHNLLELPPLFYMACVVLYALDGVNAYTIALSWIYVAFRILHCAIHTSYNNILHRMFAFLGSTAVLGMMWMHVGVLVFSRN